jgi:hypothetical protein
MTNVVDDEDAFRAHLQQIDAWRRDHADLIALSFAHFCALQEWPDADELKYQLYKLRGSTQEDTHRLTWNAPHEIGIRLVSPTRLALRAQALRDIPEAFPYLTAIAGIALITFQTYHDHGPHGQVFAADVIARLGPDGHSYDATGQWNRLMTLLDNEN